MKNILTFILLACSTFMQAQTTNPTKTLFVNGIAVPNSATAPTLFVKGSMWFDSVANLLKVWNGSSWVSQGAVASNLALGTLTTTTIPITNSNGTGFTISSATGSVAGAYPAADFSKLAAITGTNTGNQTLALTSVLGEISISAGNTVKTVSIGLTSSTDANTVYATSGSYVVSNSAGSVNFPTSAGALFGVQRAANTALGAFQIYKSSGATDDLYVRTGSGAATWNPWVIVLSRELAATIYATLASPTFTGTPNLPTGTIGVTQTAGNSTTALATTAFVTTADNLKANLASPALTGTPTAPTAAGGTNTTQIATTAFVTAALPTNYVTTNSTQTGLTGNKGWDGVHTFLNPITVGVSASVNTKYQGSSLIYTPDGGTTNYTQTFQSKSGAIALTSDITGADVRPIRAITGATTILTTDYTVYATSGTFTQPMPTTTLATGQIINITNIGLGMVTVTATSMSGQTSIPLSSGSSLQLQYTGTSGTYIIL